MKISLKRLVSKMDRSVRDHPQGDLLLGWRIRLWSAMRTEFGKEATLRRNVLAFLAAQDAYEVWQQGRVVSAQPAEDIEKCQQLPSQAMDEFVRYLKGRSSRKKVQACFEHLSDNIGYWSGRPDAPMQTAYCVFNAFSLRLLGADDEVYEDRNWYEEVWKTKGHTKITDDSLVERDFCEPYYFAARIQFQGGGKKADKLRSYWRQWLAKQVPLVLAPMPKVKALLKTWAATKVPPLAAPKKRVEMVIPKGREKDALQQHLQILATTPKGQSELYFNACQICGITMTIGTWNDPDSMAPYLAKQKASRRKQFERIIQLAEQVKADRDVNCYDYVFTSKDARWKEMRTIARALLADYSWPQKRPRKASEFLLGRAATP